MEGLIESILEFGFVKIPGGIGWDKYIKDEVEIVIVPTKKGRIPAFRYAADAYKVMRSKEDVKFIYEFLTGNKL